MRPPAVARGLDPRLAALLERVRRRAIRLDVLRVVLLASAVFLLALLAAALVDRFTFLTSFGRACAFVGVITATALAFVLAALRSFRGLRPRELAARVQAAYPDRSEIVRSAVSLAPGAAAAALDSSAFRRALQSRAAEVSGDVDVARVVRSTRTRSAAALCALAVLVTALAAAVPAFGYFQLARRVLSPHASIDRPSSVHVQIRALESVVPEGDDATVEVETRGASVESAELHWRTARRAGSMPMRPGGERIFRATLEGVTEAVDVFARAGDGESDVVRVESLPRPAVARFVKIFSPPAYLASARELRVEDASGDLRALAGSSVTLTVVATQPLRAAEIAAEFQDGSSRRIELAIDGERATIDALPLELPGEYRVELVAGETGFASDPGDAARSYAIEVFRDEPPRVVVEAPAETARAGAGGTVDRRLRMTDDYGLAEITETIRVNGEPRESRALQLGAEGAPIAAVIRGRIELRSLELDAGDRVELVWEARDVAGNTTRAEVRRVDILEAGSIEADAGFVATYRRLVTDAGELALAASDSSISAEAWAKSALDLLRDVEYALARSPDAFVRIDLRLAHRALAALALDRRLGASVAAPASGVASSLDALRRDFELRRLLVERLGFIRERLAALADAGDERALPDPELRERHALIAELRELLDATLAGDPRAPDERLVRTMLARVDHALTDLRELDAPGAWRWTDLLEEMRRFLAGASEPAGKLGILAPGHRAELARTGRPVSSTLRDVAIGAARLDAVWNDLLATAPGDVEDLRSRLARLEAAARSRPAGSGPAASAGVDGLPRFELAIEHVELTARALSPSPGADGAPRALPDLRLLEQVLRDIARDVEPRGAWVAAARSGDVDAASATRDVLVSLADGDGQPSRATRALSRAAELFALLEGSHALHASVVLAGDVAARARHAGTESRRRLDALGLRTRELRLVSTRVIAVARDAGAVDLAELVEAARVDARLEELERALDTGARESASGDERLDARAVDHIARALGTLADRLELIATNESPSVRRARAELRALLSSLEEAVAAALESARPAPEMTRALVERFSGERLIEALAAELHAATSSVELGRRLDAELDALDFADAKERERASVLDAAREALAEPSPSAEERLAGASRRSGGERDAELAAVRETQMERVAALERLARAFKALEAGDVAAARETAESMRDERAGSPESARDPLHGAAEALGELREREAALVEATRDADDPPALAPEQRAVADELAKTIAAVPGGARALEELSSELAARAERDRAALESARREIDETVGRLGAEAAARRRVRAERERALLRDIESAEREPNFPGASAPELEPSDEVRTLSARADANLRAARDALATRASDRRREAAGSLRSALESLRRARDLAAGTADAPPPAEELAQRATRLRADALVAVETTHERARRLKSEFDAMLDRRADEDRAFLEKRIDDERYDELRRERIAEDRSFRGRWADESSRARRSSSKLRDALDELDRDARAAGRSSEVSESLALADEAVVRLRDAAAEFEGIALDGIRTLERARSKLGAHEGPGLGGTLHRRLGVENETLEELLERLERLEDESAREEREEREELERQATAAERLDARADELEREAERARGLSAAVSGDGAPRGSDADAAGAESASAREAAAMSMVRALDAMSRAGRALDARRASEAVEHEREALGRIDHALRKIARALSAEGESEGRPSPGENAPDFAQQSRSSEPPTSDDARDPPTGSGEGDGPAAVGFLEAGEFARWFVALDSELKLELLQGQLDRVPARFRPVVREYFRALAEAAVGEGAR